MVYAYEVRVNTQCYFHCLFRQPIRSSFGKNYCRNVIPTLFKQYMAIVKIIELNELDFESLMITSFSFCGQISMYLFPTEKTLHGEE